MESHHRWESPSLRFSRAPSVDRAIGKVIGTKRDVYTTTATPGQSASLDFKGFSDAKTVTPFSSVVSPNGQEQPGSAEIDNIEVVPPHRRRVIPKTLTDPFKAGKCATFTNIGPVDFKAQQEASSSEFQITQGSSQYVQWTVFIGESPPTATGRRLFFGRSRSQPKNG